MSKAFLRPWLAAAVLLAGAFSAHASQGGGKSAEFLFVGSYHMNNPGRDVHNTDADDVTSARRQAEIGEVVGLLERYRPTKVFVERSTTNQSDLDRRFGETCDGDAPLSRDESEQLGMRIACSMGLDRVIAVDWNELGPITDGESIDYMKAIERHGQQERHATAMAISGEMARRDQETLDTGSVLDMLRRLNSSAWLDSNAQTYFHIGLLGTPEDPAGANWLRYWYGRNLMIFNNIARATEAGDRVLVIYGAGHGNLIRQLAADSGMYRMHDPLDWLQR